MKTDAEFKAWLDDPRADRVTLFRAGAYSTAQSAEVIRNLSNGAYGGGPAASPYVPAVAGGLQVTEALSLFGDASLTAGDIEVINTDGRFDAWLDDVNMNRSMEVLYGSPGWAEGDFRTIFLGVQAADLRSKARDRLNFKLYDKLQRLNTSMTDVKLGGTGPNKDAVQPLCFGDNSNIAPPLYDVGTQTYELHDGAIERIVEVRDNGIPIGNDSMGWGKVTVDLANGRFTLIDKPVGVVTCDVQGDKFGTIYRNTISSLVQRIVTGYGNASTRFISADLDAANLAAFETACPQVVGIFLTDRANVILVCKQLAASVGAQMLSSRTGLLRLIQVSFTGTPTATIPRTAQMDRTIMIAERTEVAAAAKIAYCQNNTEQPGLLVLIPDQHKVLLSDKWLTSTSPPDAAVQAKYKLTSEPDAEETCLQVTADADAEAVRRRDVRKVVRTTYRFEGPPSMMLLELGETRTIFSNRFGLSAGKTCVVTSLSPDWTNFRVTVEVMV